jgi:hypothetical protein
MYAMAEQKKKKLKNKADKKNTVKIIPMTDEVTDEEDMDEEDEAGGMYLEKDDMLVIYKALKNYKPVNEDEEMTHEMLIEQIEETLVVDFRVKLRGLRW